MLANEGVSGKRTPRLNIGKLSDRLYGNSMSSFANESMEFSRDMLRTQSSCLVAMSVYVDLHNLSTTKP